MKGGSAFGPLAGQWGYRPPQHGGGSGRTRTRAPCRIFPVSYDHGPCRPGPGPARSPIAGSGQCARALHGPGGAIRTASEPQAESAGVRGRPCNAGPGPPAAHHCSCSEQPCLPVIESRRDGPGPPATESKPELESLTESEPRQCPGPTARLTTGRVGPGPASRRPSADP